MQSTQRLKTELYEQKVLALETPEWRTLGVEVLIISLTEIQLNSFRFNANDLSWRTLKL